MESTPVKSGKMIPSFNDVRSQAEILALQAFMGVAFINMAWQAYHYKAMQSTLNGANVAILFIAEESVKRGMVADNVEASRSLARDLRRTVFETKEALSEMEVKFAKAREQALEDLKRTHSDLSSQTKELGEHKKELEASIRSLEGRLGAVLKEMFAQQSKLGEATETLVQKVVEALHSKH